MFGLGADPRDPVCFDNLGKLGVFGHEAVTRMDRIRACDFRSRDDRSRIEVAVGGGWRPDALVFALGFDIYAEDPQTQVAVSSEGFRRLGRAVASLGLPTVYVQEGGYHIGTLARNAQQFFGGVLEIAPG
jgi:acetoin utilization deacetylase AcuC-like enzyme